MLSALVIADDLTGAAEIAGIARRYGLPTRLAREPLDRGEPGVTVLDTDSRLLPPADAAHVVARFVAVFCPEFGSSAYLRPGVGGYESGPPAFDLIYKKTDSVLRGPVLAELESLADAFHRPAVLLVPQNPSRGRTIQAGEYRIGNAPLHTTAFANDPDHPAQSSQVVTLLGAASRGTQCIEPPHLVAPQGVTIGSGANADHLRHWANQAVATHVLPAGGAEFFEAILTRLGFTAQDQATSELPAGRRLFVCGSASSNSRAFATEAPRRGITVCSMPENISQVDAWADAISQAFKSTDRVLIDIPRALDRSSGAGLRFQSALADVVARVLAREPIDQIFVEGGATASAVCRMLGWRDFEVIDELAPGVVRMRAGSASAQQLIVKPGSYSWPDVVW